MSDMKHVLNYSYSYIERNPSTHTQIILHIVSDPLALALPVYIDNFSTLTILISRIPDKVFPIFQVCKMLNTTNFCAEIFP